MKCTVLNIWNITIITSKNIFELCSGMKFNYWKQLYHFRSCVEDLLDWATAVFSFSSVQLLSCVRLFVTPWTTTQHARPPCPPPTPGVHPNPCPLSPWCHPTISSSVVPFSSCPQSFPASGSFSLRLFPTVVAKFFKVLRPVPCELRDFFQSGW